MAPSPQPPLHRALHRVAMGRARGEEGGGGWSGDRGREQRLSQGPAPYRHAAAPEASHRGGRPHRKRETERSRDVGEKGIGEGERERGRGGVGEGERERTRRRRRSAGAAVPPSLLRPFPRREEEFGRDRERGRGSVGGKRGSGRESDKISSDCRSWRSKLEPLIHRSDG